MIKATIIINLEYDTDEYEKTLVGLDYLTKSLPDHIKDYMDSHVGVVRGSVRITKSDWVH